MPLPGAPEAPALVAVAEPEVPVGDHELSVDHFDRVVGIADEPVGRVG